MNSLVIVKRDRKVALRCLRKAIKPNGTLGKITIDKSGASTAAIASHNEERETGIAVRRITPPTTSPHITIRPSNGWYGRC